MEQLHRRELYTITILNKEDKQQEVNNIPVTEVLAVPDPASLVTVHSYTPPSEPVIIVSSSMLLLEITDAIPCLLHSNMLSRPPSAVHVILSVELKLVRTVE